MPSTIVFGASGMLGQCLRKVTEINGVTDIKFLSKNEADILDTDLLNDAFLTYQPGYVINCAAYTAVDKAEEDIENARKINKTGVKLLAEKCRDFGAILIHVSTDFVFKGDKSSPLVETDKTEPINIYGLTKREGEEEIIHTSPRHYILRTSWLYAEFGNNFVKTMRRLGAERPELKIIADQVGTPTYAIDLAVAILKIIDLNTDQFGIYHYSNEGVASWYDFAKAVFDLSGLKVKALPIPTDEYPTKATRPPYSVMDKSKIKKTFEIEIPYWRDSLAACLIELGK
jgi:dTDP-4-dehydrorhamnose reductase